MNLLLAQTAEEISQTQHAFYGMGALTFWLVAMVIGASAMLGILAMTLVVAPNITARASAALRERNGLSFLAGLPFLGAFVALAAIGQAAPGVAAIGALILSLFVLVGLAAASEDIGRRLYWACGKEGTRATHLVTGWSIFFLAACFPVIGWFVILPYVTLSGVGSLLVGAFRGGEAAPASRRLEREPF